MDDPRIYISHDPRVIYTTAHGYIYHGTRLYIPRHTVIYPTTYGYISHDPRVIYPTTHGYISHDPRLYIPRPTVIYPTTHGLYVYIYKYIHTHIYPTSHGLYIPRPTVIYPTTHGLYIPRPTGYISHNPRCIHIVLKTLNLRYYKK
jgi:hypothetical protein